MTQQPIVYEPNERPDVEVLVDGEWHAGELTMWRKRNDRDPPAGTPRSPGAAARPRAPIATSSTPTRSARTPSTAREAAANLLAMPERPDLLTQAQAAVVLGVHVATVPKLIRRGDLTTLGRRGTKGGTLDRRQVEDLAARRAAAAATPRLRPRRPAPDPRPDTEHDWITSAQAAQILGVTQHAVAQRLRRDRLPGVRHGRGWWMQRQHVELELTLKETRAARARDRSQ